jgi:hypothetical protein
LHEGVSEINETSGEGRTVALPQGFLDGGWFSAWRLDGDRRSWLVRLLSLTDE